MFALQYKNKVALVYLVSYFIDLVCMFVANVAFPQIGVQLHADLDQLSWIANSYTLGLALVIPLSVWLAERFGSKNIFILSLSIFTLAAFLCGISQSIDQLIFWRFVQGLGGGLLMPIGQSLAYQAFAREERAKLSSLIMSTAVIAPALSPMLGGLLVETLNWRWSFFINIPMALFALVLSITWLKKEKPAFKNKLDWTGVGLISFGLFSLLYGFSQFKTISDIAFTLFFLGVGASCIFIFYLHANRHHAPLFDMALFKNALFTKGLFFYLLSGGVLTGINIINIFFFQEVLGLTALKFGLLMLPYFMGSFLAIRVVGRLFNVMNPKILLGVGIAMTAIGLGLLSTISHASQFGLAVVGYMIMGMGTGGICNIAQNIAMLDISDEHMSKASAVWNLNRQMSFSFGVAFFTMCFQFLLNERGISSMTNAASSSIEIKAVHELYLLAILIVVLIPLRSIVRMRRTTVISQ